MKNYNTSLFIFRRDLRLEDNTALIAALKASNEVIPVFIFDPRQVGDQPYKSPAAVNFMAGSLRDLEGQLKSKDGRLFIFEGLAHEVLEGLGSLVKIDALYVNADYTAFSRSRDEAMMAVCRRRHIQFHSFHDVLLNPPDAVKKDDGGVYTVFTPFFRKANTVDVALPAVNSFNNYFKSSVLLEKRRLFDSLTERLNADPFCASGRKAALRTLKNLSGYSRYDEERDVPHLQATTRLSAHLKFGTISVREAHQALSGQLGIDHALVRQLYWRDFFTCIGYHYPKVLGHPFHSQYDRIRWESNTGRFKRWCEGKTGFPIVDAGMRELDRTGFMQNRVRMITASFLVKDLHIDWRWGEKYFAQKLVDYDPLVNNGNWQWVASTGCDAQPYFRVFNPWLQQKRFDPQALYIKRWVPELSSLSPAGIHRLETGKNMDVKGYPAPMLDHKIEFRRAHAMYARRA